MSFNDFGFLFHDYYIFLNSSYSSCLLLVIFDHLSSLIRNSVSSTIKLSLSVSLSLDHVLIPVGRIYDLDCVAVLLLLGR